VGLLMLVSYICVMYFKHIYSLSFPLPFPLLLISLPHTQSLLQSCHIIVKVCIPHRRDYVMFLFLSLSSFSDDIIIFFFCLNSTPLCIYTSFF
jgi:hypothetical protein